MAGSDRKRTCWPTSAEIWCWSAALLVCIGCQRTPSPVPFHRFVEDVVPGDRWHETKVQIGHETRNVLYAPYRSNPKEVDVPQDGTITLATVAEVDKLSPDAAGIRIKVEPLPSPKRSTTEDAATHLYVPVPLDGDVGALAGTKVDVLAAAEAGRKIQASARAVVTLPREHVTKTVSVPQAARLDFGIGIEGETAGLPLCAVRFSVEMERGGQRQLIFSQALEAKASGDEWGWIDVSLDLSHLAGSSVRFVFRTDSVHDEEGTRSKRVVPLFAWSPVWSSPILYTAEAESADNRPNLILISLDTLRADHLGCYGYHRDTSPNIDKFAEEAFLFENCIAPSSWTLPSHASVFTGLHPSAHDAIVFLPACRPIQKEETTLGELARRCGYVTASYTEGVLVGGSLGFAQGFGLYSDGAGVVTGAAERTFNDALKWVEQYGRLPFFLFVHTYQIHGPYRPPGRFGLLFDTDYTGPVGKKVFRPRRNLSDADVVHLEALYDGEIAYTDEVLGKFLDQLREMGLLENAVVIIFSDHGEEFREHGGVQHGVTLYDEVLRVPLIIRLAGNDPPAGRTTGQVSLTDLYATVAELLGIDHDVPTDCMSLTPLMGVSRSRARYEREIVVSEICHRDHILQLMGDRWRRYSVRTDAEKYMITEKSKLEELYNLRVDPGEKNNIAKDNQSTLAFYRALRESFLNSVKAGRAGSSPGELHPAPFSEEHRRRLKALGYM